MSRSATRTSASVSDEVGSSRRSTRGSRDTALTICTIFLRSLGRSLDHRIRSDVDLVLSEQSRASPRASSAAG